MLHRSKNVYVVYPPQDESFGSWRCRFEVIGVVFSDVLKSGVPGLVIHQSICELTTDMSLI